MSWENERWNRTGANWEEEEDVAELARYHALNNDKDEMLYRDNPDYREAYDSIKENTLRMTETQVRNVIKRVLIESAGFTVYSERGKYIESSDGSLLQLAGMDEPKIIVSNGRERGSLVLHRGGRIYLQTNRMDKFFSTLQELCDYLNQNDFEYDGIDDY